MSPVQTPLRPLELLVLTVLAGGDRHGYGIRQEILESTQGQVEVEAGNLYRHIRRLEDNGYLLEVAAPRSETDERRIFYRLTPSGRRTLSAELQRLRDLVRYAERKGILLPARACSSSTSSSGFIRGNAGRVSRPKCAPSTPTVCAKARPP